MPYKSRSQMRAFFAKEERGELPEGTAKRWAHHTKNMKDLPEHKKSSSVPASQEEIDVFVKAAMDRYEQVGLPKDLAEKLLTAKMAQVAEMLGVVERIETPEERIVNAAAANLMKRGYSEKDARIAVVNAVAKQAHEEKIASIKRAVMNKEIAFDNASQPPSLLKSMDRGISMAAIKGIGRVREAVGGKLKGETKYPVTGADKAEAVGSQKAKLDKGEISKDQFKARSKAVEK